MTPDGSSDGPTDGAADQPTGNDESQTGAASVAEEAMRLAEAFSVWAQNSKLAADAAATPDDATGAGREEQPDTRAAEPKDADARHPEPRDTVQHCDCAHGPAVEAVCRMCPVCRLAGLVQAVQPDLLDRVADLLGVVAGGLRTAAQDRRTADDPGAGTPGADDMEVPVTDGAEDGGKGSDEDNNGDRR